MESSGPSLRKTIETVDELLFHYLPITQAEREAFSMQILSCQIHSGPEAGLFSHASLDGDNAPRLFSGERIYTQLAARHTLLIDSARILTRLKVSNGAVTRALELAKQKMEARCYASFCAVGECRHLTIAFMRYLIACDSPASNLRLDSFFMQLAAHREPQGRWGSFPFYYTLLMLGETGHPLAVQEQYRISMLCGELLERSWNKDLYSVRREIILIRARAGDA